MTPEELSYWADKAALLDPECFTFVEGAGWDLEVPLGENWYLYNAWHLRYIDNNFSWHHRKLNDPLLLSPGFRLRTTSYDFGFAYYANPKLVQQGDCRYSIDPKKLYYERLNKLRTIKLENLAVHIPIGTTIIGSPYAYATFPLGSDKILLRHVDCMDGCWVILCGEDLLHNAMNTQDELDDIRPIRSTSSLCLPIKQATHPGILLGRGVVSANIEDKQTYHGWGSVLFQRLPSDW